MFRSLKEYVKAKEYHEKALTIRKETGDKEGEGISYRNLGTVLHIVGEYGKAKEYHEKALAISQEIGDRRGEAVDCGNLGTVLHSLGEHSHAKEYCEEALVIRKETGDRKGEAVACGNLGTVLHSLGEYCRAKEYYEKALVIRAEVGDREGEAADYGNLGSLFYDLGEYGKAKEYVEKALAMESGFGDREGEAANYGRLGTVFLAFGHYDKAKEYHEKALEISNEIGKREGEASAFANLANVFYSLQEYDKAKEYHEKSLAIRKEIGDREEESLSYGNLGAVFYALGEYGKAKECYKTAITISEELGTVEVELRCQENLAVNTLLEGEKEKAFWNLVTCVNKYEDMRGSLRENDEFEIFFSDKHASPFKILSAMLCNSGYTSKALYVVELRRARALADLMSAQYHVRNQASTNPQSWFGIERNMDTQGNCTCLYISYFSGSIFIWILKANNPTLFRRLDVNNHYTGDRSIKDLDKFLRNDISFRKFYILPPEHCEDRSFFHSESDVQPTGQSSQVESPLALRLVMGDEQGDQEPEPSLSIYYKLIIAPVADLLDEPAIIIVPDRSFYNVPFAALKRESGSYLSETFRIRIVPSLTTLRLIQDSPAGYHSQTGALIVGDPEVGNVMYKGRLERKPPLPCARKEAEMIGRLLGAQPLLGKQATKQAVLQRIHSVSLVHFAAHGNAERNCSCPTTVY